MSFFHHAAPSPGDADVDRLVGQRLVALLGWTIAALVVLGPVTSYVDHAVRSDREDPGAPLVVSRLLDLNREASVPTWFSVALLLLLAVVFAASAVTSIRPVSRAYAALAAAAAWMSLDEAAAAHELLAGLGRDVAPQGRELTAFVWVLPGAVVTALAGAGLLAVGRALPAWQRRDLVRAGMLYLTGALAIESTTAAVAPQVGLAELLMLAAVEEGLEMVAVLLAVRTALRALQLQRTPAGLLLSTRSFGSSRTTAD